MGYCTYGGKPVPVNDQAGCIGGGGNWVDDIAPIQRGGVNIQHPYSQANTDQLTALSNVTGAGTLGKVVNRVGAGLPGRFNGQPNTVQQVQKAAKPIQGPAQQKLTDIGKIGTTTPTKLQSLDNAVYKAGQYVGNNPIKATVAASSVGVPAYNMFNAGEPVTDKKVVQNNTPVNQQSPLVTKEQRKARDVAIMKEQNAAEAPTVPPTAPTTNKKNDGLLVDGLTGDDLKGVAESGDIPTSMWDKMQTKGYWMDGVEGGSGKWDNRLFRLGEMMAHMGTPLSKQGKSPAERWTTANTASVKKQAALDKANKPKVTKPLTVSASSISPYINTALTDEFSSIMGFGGMDKAEMDGESKLMAENVRKRVKAIEDNNPGKRADIKKIADDELAKFRVRYNK